PDLHGKTALVTGAGRGIGAAIALDLARAGADVVINYSRSQAQAAEVQKAIQSLGQRAMTVQADVSQKTQIDRMFDQIEGAWGPVDILVNNAGIEFRKPVREITEELYDQVMDTNLKGAFFCAQRALEGMKQKGWGRVINISSVHEITPTGFCCVYSMSKGGMRLMMRELALEYSRFGITVNNVAPGAIRTDINREVLSDPAYEAKVISKIPAGFIGMPEDVSKMVVFLASDEARYITGAVILIDGGLGLR
ncbi:MAG TPA: glucose 1-dehydrogenase, partial [Thermoguttaceae bacterium]|nr:glucose 1-dehydrogenase [Thermoguttaceae bacterium]